MLKVTSVAIALLALVPPSAASDFAVEIDPERTSIGFHLEATLHSVHGHANLVSGRLRLDNTIGTAVGEVVIEATSATTANTKRDKKMHTQVLRTADHPRIIFRASHLEGELAVSGASDVILHGEIEILGEPRAFELPLHVEIADGGFTANGGFDIPYVEWGLKDPSTFVLRVAKVVEVSVEAAGDVTVVE